MPRYSAPSPDFIGLTPEQGRSGLGTDAFTLPNAPQPCLKCDVSYQEHDDEALGHEYLDPEPEERLG